ncbi:acyltransferase family protein [Sulfitobacter donghicola]|uniref:Acyltransferase 3 domain-containing protein n=1 Tax=Sulfitobacter donghicola DSW-25 = KCTC 12864 = JCM 14565 TaxID=1300350 RepID=A0A073ITY5_9RHOB|nr:acyltransferase family protein [Sulfitobacter donghicola]KEJ88867.1 hypothetical protein DSW25_13200 [Sulfitobacter donghicola DSW-25 = KCTC 12864 = JCM 14565]KIN68380.1 Acyltransferase/acetyltransferase [Sulfitobacter donghicola DSW-25 = KCTC 12864 = JCM 14565]
MTHAMTNSISQMASAAHSNHSTRFGAIDSAKGVGIILVVFGHAWRGAMGAGLISDDRLFRYIDAAIYAFHMPLFFFLSGLLFLETLQKYDTGKLLRGRLTRLLWPMALWTWLFFGLKLVAGGEANTPVTVADFPLIPLPPYEHLWFLWALFLIQGILVLLFAALPKSLDAWQLRRFASSFGMLMVALSSFIFVPSLLWGPMVEHAPYFLLGIGAGGLLHLRPPLAVGALGALGFGILTGLVGGEKASVLHSVALLVCAWAAWLFVDGALDPNGLIARSLRYLGQASMAIYLTHTAFTAAVRIVMLKVGAADFALVLPASVLAGLIFPLFVLFAARKLGATKLLGF